MDKYLWLIPALPLAGFLVNALLRPPRGAAAAVACAGPIGSFVLSLLAVRQYASGGASIVQDVFTWIGVGSVSVPFGLQVDGLGAVMVLVVTGVGSLIHVYSVGYMREDPGFARYFAYLNLFMFAMLVLVMAKNILLMFVGWEGVGLCSYLLIGFWYRDLKNADAGKKAFVTNRVGDLGFILGIFCLWRLFGTLDFGVMKGAMKEDLPGGWMLAAGLLLFLGACGKSAQIPLYVWLPDAMAGPTPVSALIHAATMVTAGVYMVGRMGFLYAAVPCAMEVIGIVAVLTALLAAVIAVAQNDIKKVLAYSTISQLGFMFAGMAAEQFATGIFHVVTHSFFKALLFLGAGAVIHALHGEQDIRKMGGLASRMPWVTGVFVAGALALAGLWPFAGFFSKDLILAAVLKKGWHAHFALLVLTAGLTAFYTGRLVILVFLMKPSHEHRELHRTGAAMMAPLLVLAALSVAGGFSLEHAVVEAVGSIDVGSAAAAAKAASTAACLLGLLGAGAAFLRRREAVRRFVDGPGKALHTLVSNKFYVDEAYDILVVRPLRSAAVLSWYVADRVIIDTILVHGAAWLTRALGGALRRAHTGSINMGTGTFALGALAVMAYIFYRFAIWAASQS